MNPKFYSTLLFVLLLGTILINAQPLPPENLTAVQGSSYYHPVFVKLNWEAPAAMMVRFNVYRKYGALSDTGAFVKRYSNIGHMNFNDYQVQPGHTYSYYVTSVNLQGESGPSNKVEISLTQGPANGNVSGLVTDDNTNLPVPHATAQFFRTSGYMMGFTARTDSNGIFNITLPADTYYLKTASYGYYREFFDNVQTLEEATPIIITDGAATNLSIGLAPVMPPVTYTLTGDVKDSLGNPLMAFIKVLSIRNNTHHHGFMSSRTDSLGNYSVNVREGDTVVVFAMPLNRDYFPEFWDNKFTYQEADRIPVAGNITGINFVLSHRPVFQNGISGLVADSLGTPVESFVSAMRLYTPHFKRYIVSSDSLGNYSFTNLLPGKYILLACPKEGYMPTFFRYDGMPTMNWRLADSVMVDETSLITGIDFTVHPLPFGEGMVTGIVADKTGEPVNGAFVYAENSSGEISGYAITNPSGNYIMSGLFAGEYNVKADMIEYTASSPVGININYSGGLTQTANLSLIPESVTGTQNSKPEIVEDYQLYQNYPNPFNPVTNIKFSLPERSNVKITVYNLLGIQVAQILNDVRNAGIHTVSFDASNLASGVYFYKLETGKFTSTKKLTLLK